MPGLMLMTCSHFCVLYKNRRVGVAQSVESRLRAGRPGFNSKGDDKIFFPIATASKPALEPTQPPFQCVPATLSLGVKRLGREADH
jgi:hypothetical protein